MGDAIRNRSLDINDTAVTPTTQDDLAVVLCSRSLDNVYLGPMKKNNFFVQSLYECKTESQVSRSQIR